MRHVTTRFSGLVILIAGIWGGLIPFVGPYFHFVLGPDQHWKWTTGRLWLNVLPGAVAALGGLILMGGGPRVSGRFGALLALAAGIWFAVGPDVSMLWNHGVSQAGGPVGKHTFKRMLELVTFHSGLGVLITAFAAYALPGVTRRRRVAEDAAVAGAGAAEARHRDRVAERESGAGAAGAGAADASAGAGAGAAREREVEPGPDAGAAREREVDAGGTGGGPTGAGAAGAGAGAGGVGGAPTDPASPRPGDTGTGMAGGGAARPAATSAGTRRSGGLLSRLFGPRT